MVKSRKMPIPAYIISILFFVGASLCAFSAWRHNEWTGKLFSPVLFAFSLLYTAYNIFDVDIFVRQIQVRLGLAVIAVVVIIWRVVLIWLMRKNADK